MEMQLQELIDQIRKDGVEAGEAKAASILEAANVEADRIVKAARAEADHILQAAKEENVRLVRVSEDAIRQAGRNSLISFRESVNRQLNAIVADSVMTACSSENLVSLITAVVEAWAKNGDSEDMTVLLNSRDLKELEDQLLAALKEKMLTGVTLKANDNFDGGFRIAVSEGRAYYDYSAAAVVELFSAYLNPRVTALMKEAEEV